MRRFARDSVGERAVAAKALGKRADGRSAVRTHLRGPHGGGITRGSALGCEAHDYLRNIPDRVLLRTIRYRIG